MAKNKKYDKSEGVWRTIGGRHIFIKHGQKLGDAMKASGKFNKMRKDVADNIEIKDMEEETIKRKGVTAEEYRRAEKNVAQLKRERDALDVEVGEYEDDEFMTGSPAHDEAQWALQDKEDELREATKRYNNLMKKDGYMERKYQMPERNKKDDSDSGLPEKRDIKGEYEWKDKEREKEYNRQLEQMRKSQKLQREYEYQGMSPRDAYLKAQAELKKVSNDPRSTVKENERYNELRKMQQNGELKPYSKEDYELRDLQHEKAIKEGLMTREESNYQKARLAWQRDEISREEFDKIKDNYDKAEKEYANRMKADNTGNTTKINDLMNDRMPYKDFVEKHFDGDMQDAGEFLNNQQEHIANKYFDGDMQDAGEFLAKKAGVALSVEELEKAYMQSTNKSAKKKILSGDKGLSSQEIEDMSPLKGGKLYSELTDQEKELKEELHLRDMAMSAWIYGGDLHTDKDVNSAPGNENYYNKPYINKFYDRLGKDRTEEILKQQKDYFNRGKVQENVSTDSEGLSYNSFIEPDKEIVDRVYRVKNNRVVENIKTGTKYYEVGNGQWRSEKDGYDYYIDFNSSNKDNPQFRDVASGRIINDNPRANNYWDYEGNGLLSRYQGTVEYLRKTYYMSTSDILELLKKIDKDSKK